METIVGVKEKEEQHVQEQVVEEEELKEEQAGTAKEEVSNPSSTDVRRSCSSAKSDEDEEKEEDEEVGPRERLKRHRREVAGNVGIPDSWGQENFLTEWIDCTAFDASLLNPRNILLARSSLIRQQTSPLPLPLPLPLPPLPLENSC